MVEHGVITEVRVVEKWLKPIVMVRYGDQAHAKATHPHDLDEALKKGDVWFTGLALLEWMVATGRTAMRVH